jgi:eukaryotic-like serine/threonine-protein kinase
MSDEQLADSGQCIGEYEIQAQQAMRPGVAIYAAQARGQQTPAHFLLATADEGADRFKRQMELLAQLAHPGIPQVLETGVTPQKQPYAIVADVSGTALAERLTGSAPFTPIEALQLARQLAEILSVLHPAGIIHQDLRPEHILLDNEGQAHLLHLGLAGEKRPFDPHSPSLDYAAPEQQKGHPATSQSNIYSLGVILYHLLAGEPPPLPQSHWNVFHRDQPHLPLPLHEVKEGLTEETYNVVKTCLYSHEWGRYQTTDKLLTALDQALAAEQAALERPSGWLARLAPRQRYLVAGAGLLLLLALIAGIVFLLN